MRDRDELVFTAWKSRTSVVEKKLTVIQMHESWICIAEVRGHAYRADHRESL